MEKYQDGQGTNPNQQRMRKLIPVDFDLKLDEDNDCSKGSDVVTCIKHGFNKYNSSSCYRMPPKISQHYHTKRRNSLTSRSLDEEVKSTDHEYFRYSDELLESYESAGRWTKKIVDHRYAANNTKLPHSLIENGCASQSQNYVINSATLDLGKRESLLHEKPIPTFRNNTKIDPSVSKKDDTEINCITLDNMIFEDRLSLTLAEVVHIRSVLTKAELESLPVEGRVKEDVEKRRVCFLCLKTRFGLLGPWGQRCRLCERTVCVKCFSKMKIPPDHFARIPVILLSPGLDIPSSSTKLDSDNSAGPLFKYRHCLEPAQTSSAIKCYNSEKKNITHIEYDNGDGDNSELRNYTRHERSSYRYSRKRFENSSKLHNIAAFRALRRRSTGQEIDIESTSGILVAVCHDCHMMVYEIIKASRLTRSDMRNNVISRLTLNLAPAYV